MSPEITERFEVLRRCCTRGRTHFLTQGDSRGVDSFEHLETELERLRLALLKQEQVHEG